MKNAELELRNLSKQAYKWYCGTDEKVFKAADGYYVGYNEKDASGPYTFSDLDEMFCEYQREVDEENRSYYYFCTNSYDAIAILEGDTVYVFPASSADPLLPHDEDKEAFCEKARAYLMDNADDFDITNDGWTAIPTDGKDITDLLDIEEIYAEI